MPIDHDRLFKELIKTFFIDFIVLFFPEVLQYLDTRSITFVDKEVFTDVTSGESHEVDLVAKIQFKGQLTYFLVHVEAQSTRKPGFARRMLRYFGRLYDEHDIPIYPIVVFSYDTPLNLEGTSHTVEFPGFIVNHFQFKAVQMNKLNWRDFVKKKNPIAAAFMSKMQIAPEDRIRVKFECLRLMSTLKLNPARMRMISGFIDTYIKLTKEENKLLDQKLETIPNKSRGKFMQIVTSWMEEGIAQGMLAGMQKGRTAVSRLQSSIAVF